jgi:hypothetical protein
LYTGKTKAGLKFSLTIYSKTNGMIATRNYQNKKENISEEHIMNSSCGCGGNNQQISKNKLETKYQCPMNCEGNKTYNQPGECPVCNMELVMVGQDEPRIWIE